MKVSEIMTREVITLAPEQTLEQAARVLVEKRVSGVPVVKDGKVVGVLSERDLLGARTNPRPPRYLELLGGIIYLDSVRDFSRQLEKMTATTVAELMTHPVISVTVDTALEDVARIFVEDDINRVPVLDKDGKLAGIVTRSDALRGAMENL